MAFNNFQTNISQGSDASFRIWGQELANAMQGCGLVKHTDTGQINWTTVVRAAANTAAGYEIYRFADALQATYPVYIKIEYGSGAGGSAAPQLWITAGTSTNGAGVIGTVKTSRFPCASGNGIASTVTAYHSFISYKNGFLGVVFKCGASALAPNALFTFCVGRSVDDAGAETGDAIWLAHKMDAQYAGGQAGAAGGIQLQCLRVAANTLATSPDAAIDTNEPFNYCLVPFGPSTSAVAADFQAYKWYITLPRVRPLMQVCTYLTGEISFGATFTTALVGTTPRTYMSFGASTAHCSQRSVSAFNVPGNNHAMAILWEA